MVLAIFTAVLLVLTAIAIYGLQSWLERWDHDRHAED
jgi:hypothetical protein